MRPYEAPKSSRGGDRGYFVRQGAETVEVKGGPLRSQLFEQAAKIPFDDRRSLTDTTDRISEGLVRAFLRDVQRVRPKLPVHKGRHLPEYATCCTVECA